MTNIAEMNKLLSKMTTDDFNNIKLIKKAFGSIDYTDEHGLSLLHILVDERYNEEKCFLAIRTLLFVGLNVNITCPWYDNDNFIQTAFYTGYSEAFMLKIIHEALRYGLNVNYVNDNKETMMHCAIYSDEYKGKIATIFRELTANGLSSSLKDSNNRDIFDAIYYKNKENGKYSLKDINSFKLKYGHEIKKSNEDNEAALLSNSIEDISSDDWKTLKKYGNILNENYYITSPAIGREKELVSLMISLAQDKKSPIIVGESGVGKTAIVDELAYRIKNRAVPTFLQNKIIYEITPDSVVSGCKYLGMFQENMDELIKICEKYDIILFIDEIHTIYGTGSTEDNKNDMASMIKHYLDRSRIKVIGATTENEYQEFFSNDALKRRFEPIKVKEPTERVLYDIISSVFDSYCIKNGFIFDDYELKNKIINILIEVTAYNNRVYNDRVNNPDLVISIIDKAFAFAKYYDSDNITVQHFINSIEYCDRIYDFAKNRAINEFNEIKKDTKIVDKVLKIDTNRFKR